MIFIYQPGMFAQVLERQDPDGAEGARLVEAMYACLEDQQASVAIDAAAYVLASVLSTAPREVRMGVAHDVLDDVRDFVLESFD
jgi:hypothetical protein